MPSVSIKTLTTLTTLILLPFTSAINCPTGVQIIGARGTTQSPGLGSTEQLANLIRAAIPGSSALGLPYPASMHPSYAASERAGANAMQNHIEYFATRCPQTPIVLLGYSQGAQVTLDALCGTSSARWRSTPRLDERFVDNIAAIAVMGDPSHTVGKSYNRGTSRHNGIFPRGPAACVRFASKLISFCDAGDPYCDNGNNINVHHSYRNKYNTVAAAWAIQEIRSFLRNKRKMAH